jgi:16S rRNA processing protein RimM
MNSKKILVGKVVSAFGIKGEVKIVSFCQEPIKIETYALFDEKGNPLKLKISNKNKAIVGKSHEGAILLARIEGVDDRTAAEKLNQAPIYANRDEFDEVDENEFYQVDLIGLAVQDESGKTIGKVLNILDFGGGAALEIEFIEVGIRGNLQKIENFPFKNEIFPQVNVGAGFIVINFPDFIEIK